MNRRVTLLSIVLILVAGSQLFGQPKTAPTSLPDKARLEQVLAAWATLDPSKPAVFYAKDPGLAFYDVAPRIYKGWAEYEKGARDMFKTMRSLSLKMHDADVHTAGNVAWTTALVDAVENDKDGKQEKMDARIISRRRCLSRLRSGRPQRKNEEGKARVRASARALPLAS